MDFTKENGVLIKILRQSKDNSARKLLAEFPDKDWTSLALDRLLRQIDATGSADMKSGISGERVRSTQETCKCLCKWRPFWAQTVTDGIAYKLVRRLFHIGNFCFWVPFFKQLLLKNCAVDFVEISNVCTRKAIIKAAKRISNSDKFCRSYCDFYFGVTFFGTQCIYIHIPFFSSLNLQVRPLNGSWCTIYQNTRNHARFKPLGVKIIKINIYTFFGFKMS